jgi:hypothetical protein
MRARTVLATLTLASCASLTVGFTAAADPDHKSEDRVERQLQTARFATGAYFSEKLAPKAGYQRTDECVSSSEGGMGYHYLNPDHIGSTHPGKPAAVLYEPGKKGKRNMVAAEYIVRDADQKPATVERHRAFGQRLKGPLFLPQLGWHYALHVWLWKDNPSGLFADWNPRVHCPKKGKARSERPTG